MRTSRSKKRTRDRWHRWRCPGRARLRNGSELKTEYTLQWRHNGRDSISNHQPHGCLLNRLFRRRSKKTSKLRVTGLLCGEFTGDRWIPRTNGQLRGNCFHLITSSWTESRYNTIWRNMTRSLSSQLLTIDAPWLTREGGIWASFLICKSFFLYNWGPFY